MHDEFDLCDDFVPDTWSVVILSPTATGQFASHQQSPPYFALFEVALLSKQHRFGNDAKLLPLAAKSRNDIWLRSPSHTQMVTAAGISSRQMIVFAGIRWISNPFFFPGRFMRRVESTLLMQIANPPGVTFCAFAVHHDSHAFPLIEAPKKVNQLSSTSRGRFFLEKVPKTWAPSAPSPDGKRR